MKEYIYLGKIVNTHGIKGELRILSDFERKTEVFQKGFPIYIGNEKRKEIIKSYRSHKMFDMICYENITNINEVLKDKGKSVYIKRSDLHLKENEYLLNDLMGFEVVNENNLIGKIIDIVYNKAGILFLVETPEKKRFYIPKNENFIEQIEIKNKKIKVQNIEGLIL